MVASSATATASSGSTKLGFSSPRYMRRRMPKPTKRLMSSSKLVIYGSNCSSSARVVRSVSIKAFDPQEESIDNNDTAAIVSQEDWSYLWKLGAGSVLGAAFIKYGSILGPEVTRPNIVLALTIISTPVIIAVLLLINQSRVQR
ncbi:hypothetical protein CFOL_v3_29234 [Cephalotus follicularis]|uniref:Uncharacterized protein n=1 Tax=Cephalotus follicularis TaxID=3775 RepID=A0A1Q3CZY7_CEPFO|nr:hypothetical protein CFOL_v3_29234 [Cephalotus follicularis]